MIALDFLRSLEVVLSGAVTTNELPVAVTWREVGSINNPSDQIYAANLLTDGVTPVTLVSTPKSKFTRVVESISVFNDDTESATVILQIRYNNLTWNIVSISLAKESNLTYLSNEGWKVIDKNGSVVASVPVPNINFVSTNTQLDDSHDIVIITVDGVIITLPAAVDNATKKFTIYMQALGTSQILPSVGETIRSTDGFYLEQTNKIEVVSTGSEWI